MFIFWQAWNRCFLLRFFSKHVSALTGIDHFLYKKSRLPFCRHGTSYRLKQLSGAALRPNLLDMLKAAFQHKSTLLSVSVTI
jgi:hypothetical protein